MADPDGPDPDGPDPDGPDPDGPVLAIDIGGTKVAAGLVDTTGRLIERTQAATADAAPGPDGLFDLVVALAVDVRNRRPDGPIACGVGCGGPSREHNTIVSPLNIPAWREFPLRDRLVDALGMGVFVDNDAKALALGEGWVGAAAGVSDYIGMVVSTGIGGGIVLEGRLLDGADGNAGHIGHLVVDPGGRADASGARGSLEGAASGTAIAAATGHPAAEADPATRRRTGQLVGQAIASVANLLDLRLAVVSGSVALGFGAEFFDEAQRVVDDQCRLIHSRGTRVVPGALGDAGPLIGAAAVARRGLGTLTL